MSTDQFFQKIYKETYDSLLRYIENMCQNRFVAEDILQETYFEAFLHRETLAEHGNVRGWLYKTAGYKMRNYLRKQHKGSLNLDEIQECGNYESMYTETEWKMTLGMLLGEEDAEVFWRYYALGQTGSEMAKWLGITENCLKVRMHRIKKKLQVTVS